MTLIDLRRALGHPNVAAFLRVLRAGESSQTDDAYRMMFGGGLFDVAGGWQHPNVVNHAAGLSSTAAGAYQFLHRTWYSLCQQYPFPDFAPKCQDMGAVALIAGRGALQDVIDGRLDAAIAKCNKEWASLPGSPYGQPVLSMARCRAVYAQWGGTEAGVTATAAGVTAIAAPATAIATDQPQGKTMDPLSLVSILAGVFSPIIRAKAQKALGSDVGSQLADNLLAVTQQVTGKTDPLEAVAVARQQPEMVAKIEAAAADWLAQMGPALAQTVDWDKEKWQAEREGRDAASERAIKERGAGVWDMTPFLVRSLLVILWGIAWGLLGAILYLVIMKEEPNQMVLAALIGLAGPIWTGAIVASVVAIVAYRFDGTKESSEQTKAVADAIRQRGPA